jgi:hypothetical protein
MAKYEVIDSYLYGTNPNWKDAVIVDACDAYEAAEYWAEMDDIESAEFSIIKKGKYGPVLVRCMESDDEPVLKIMIRAKSVPHYSAEDWKE